MPKTFAVVVPGDPPMRDGSVPARPFRWDVESKTLSTDLGTDGGMEDPLSGAPSQKEVTITEENYEHNPDYIRFWRATATHRIAFELCENEGLSMEDALKMAEQMNGNDADVTITRPEMSYEPPPDRAYEPPPEVVQMNGRPDTYDEFGNNVPNQPLSEPEPETNPVAGIVITNQQTVLEMAFELLEQYIPEDDKNRGMFELLKRKAEELDGYEIVI